MRRLFVGLPLLTVLAFFLLSFSKTTGELSVDLPPSYTDGDFIGCGPADNTPIIISDERKMIPLPGWGQHRWKIETASDSAQFYFDQGLSLFYGFHMQEAQASFKEAQRHDPTCAMAFWGQAMAEGPYINSPQYNYNSPDVISGLAKAASTAKTELERLLIDAQQIRYTAEKNANLYTMAVSYQNRMQELYQKYSGNVDVAVLYADAMMMVNPRDWYDEKGKEKRNTAQIVELLDRILKQSPSHPAALHYYIHIVEPSTTPERAKQAADILLPLMPSVAHMVHMPSHIYMRTGDYSKGITSNIKAIEGYRSYQKMLGGWEGNRYTYFFHNADMQGASAVSIGDYEAASTAYGSLLSGFKSTDSAFFGNAAMSNVMQYLTSQVYLLDVRFGKWDKLLQSKTPLTNRPNHQLLWQFGKGMAYAKTGKLTEAMQSLEAMKVLSRDSSLNAHRPNRNSAIDPARIALLILEGTIHSVQKNWTGAITAFQSAVSAEDALRYSEPEDWRLHARHYLGQAFLEQQNWDKAKIFFEEDLVDHPANFWALNGLYQTLLKQDKMIEAKALKTKHNAVFAAGPKSLDGATY